MKKLLALFVSTAFCSFLANGQTVLLSKANPDGNYNRWLLRQNPNLKLVSLADVSKDSVQYWLKNASGFLMTGGEDIYPARYGKEADTSSCGTFDQKRDSLEFQMLDYAFSYKKPLFGICRGMQLINVYLKGSLIVDIPTRLGIKVRHREEGSVEHNVSVITNTKLAKICKTKQGLVLSNHHQGIDKLGKTLMPSSNTEDGLIESIEGDVDSKMPFLMAVQWHPEKMNADDHLSKSLAAAFVKSMAK